MIALNGRWEWLVGRYEGQLLGEVWTSDDFVECLSSQSFYSLQSALGDTSVVQALRLTKVISGGVRPWRSRTQSA